MPGTAARPRGGPDEAAPRYRRPRVTRGRRRWARLATSGVLATSGGYLLVSTVLAPPARAASTPATGTPTAPTAPGTPGSGGAGSPGSTGSSGGTPGCTTAGQPIQCAWWNEATTNGSTAAPSTTSSNELEASFIPGESNLNGTPAQGAAPQTSTNGILAYAAIQYTLPSALGGAPYDPSAADVKLTLTVDMTNTAANGTPPLLACTALSSWQPGPDQPGQESPPYTCKGKNEAKPKLDATPGPVPGSAASETLSWTLTPDQELQPGTVDVVLVPDTTAQQPFRVALDDPTSTSFAVEPGAAGSGNGTGSGGAAGAGTGAPAGATVAPTTGAAGTVAAGGGAFTPAGSPYVPVGSTASGSTLNPAAFSPGPAPSVQGGPPSAGATGGSTGFAGLPGAALALAKGPLSSTGERVFGGVLLLLAAAGLLLVGTRSARMPRLLGPLAAIAGRTG